MSRGSPMASPWSEKQKLNWPSPEKTSRSHGRSGGSAALEGHARSSEPGLSLIHISEPTRLALI
eukprot:9632127-Alexandrium_andersonii.AAC.1